MNRVEFMNLVRTRRSVRKYEDKEIPFDIVHKILEAGMYAPSARNQRPWEFLVITERDILTKIPIVNSYAKMAEKASIAILIVGNLDLETSQGYWIQDCSAATENLLLACHAFGLGAVWTGIYPREEKINAFKKLFGLPENIIPFALIPIGYPAEKPVQPNRLEKDKVHYNKWEKKEE